jgi:hypothetical protein
MVRERHPARYRHVAPSDQAHILDGMMGGAKESSGDPCCPVAGKARDAVDACGLDGYGEGYSKPQHCFQRWAKARRGIQSCLKAFTARQADHARRQLEGIQSIIGQMNRSAIPEDEHSACTSRRVGIELVSQFAPQVYRSVRFICPHRSSVVSSGCKPSRESHGSAQ